MLNALQHDKRSMDEIDRGSMRLSCAISTKTMQVRAWQRCERAGADARRKAVRVIRARRFFHKNSGFDVGNFADRMMNYGEGEGQERGARIVYRVIDSRCCLDIGYAQATEGLVWQGAVAGRSGCEMQYVARHADKRVYLPLPPGRQRYFSRSLSPCLMRHRARCRVIEACRWFI